MSTLHIRPIARRRFVQGLAIGGAVAGFAPALLAIRPSLARQA
ncbi:twin-arginine translocation signal domain-containing protein [Sphingobium herbicidovorans]